MACCGMAEDYPKTLLAFPKRFATEAACRESLVEPRWPGGFECPRCGYRKAWQVTRERHRYAKLWVAEYGQVRNDPSADP
ncbi:MAG: transposase [Burkholderiales bacterium]